MATLFTLNKNDFKDLGADRAVELFRRLLWAEASRVGVGKYLINTPGCINVGDGGIDAYIENGHPTSDDVIPNGTTGFQIKSSDLTEKACAKELYIKNNLSKDLKPELKRILDSSGNYVLVLFADITSGAQEKRKQAIIAELKRLGYSNSVRVYTIYQLISFSERFISLVFWLKPEYSQCLPYSSWAGRSDIKTPNLYVADDERGKWTSVIREKLRDPQGTCPIFRITGLSGIGKTRFIFETLSPEDLKNNVIYSSSANDFRNSSLYHALQNDPSLSAIIVIDECDKNLHDDFTRSFSDRGGRLALITLSNTLSNFPSPTMLFKLNALSEKEIEQLIQGEAPELPSNVVHRLSQFSDGYPRIATLLSKSYLLNGGGSPDDFIRISDDGLMERLIGDREISSEQLLLYKKVLTGISLFQKIGYEGPLEFESQWLAGFMGVEWPKYQDAVRYERRRGIIQGTYFLYVTPFMLRVFLFNEWWRDEGFTKENFEQLITKIPENFRLDLMNRFLEHIPYISETERGRSFAKTLLGENGIFSDGELLRSEFGANFFLKLTEADAASALGCLQRTVGKWSHEELLAFTIGRRQIVNSLERIVVWKELFVGGSRILMALAEAENESWANNASGIFAELFSPGAGGVAPTEASPEHRFPILVEAIDSPSKKGREIALNACNQALETRWFSRMVGSEHQGVRKLPNLWSPQTYQEIFEFYKNVWTLLSEKIGILQDEERKKGLDILVQRSYGIGLIPSLVDMVISTLRQLITDSYLTQQEIIPVVLNITRYDQDRAVPEVLQTWEEFKKEIIKDDFLSLMHRYVMSSYLEDEVDAEGKIIDVTQNKIRSLAEQVVNQPELLTPELNWLVTPRAGRGFQFGFELGTLDEGFSFLPTIIQAQKDSGADNNRLFLAGYFKTIFDHNQGLWEDLMDKFVVDEIAVNWIPELTWRSGISDRAAIRFLKLAQAGIIPINNFRLFALGNVIKNLSEERFLEWLQFLIESDDEYSTSIILSLHHQFYVGNSGHKLPGDLTFKVLTKPFLEDTAIIKFGTMDDYYWFEISKAFIENYPEKMLDLAAVTIGHFREVESPIGGIFSKSNNVLDLIAQQKPTEVWGIVVKYIGPPIDRRAYQLKEWLNGGIGFDEQKNIAALEYFKLEDIFQWVDANVEKRAWYVASMAPKKLFRDSEKPCIAREILVRYGKRKDVKDNLHANFMSEGWRGPASVHLENKKNMLLEYRTKEDNDNMLAWIEEFVASLNQQIEVEKMREEREGY
jgi:hypothetical protein